MYRKSSYWFLVRYSESNGDNPITPYSGENVL